MFYCEELMAFTQRGNSKDNVIRASYEKIICYQHFNKYDLAFRLALSVEQKYCSEINSDEICKSCNKIYKKISEFMEFMDTKKAH